MTTTSERLLQIADEHEQTAAALRIAARELTTERTQTAVQKFSQRLSGAVAHRAAARNGSNGHQRNGGDRHSRTHQQKIERRRHLIADFLGDGVHTIDEIASHLSKKYHLRHNRNTFWMDLKKMGAVPDASVKHGYRLPATNGNGHATPAVKKAKKSAKKSKRASTSPMLPVVLKVLRDANGPLPIKELSQRVRVAGGGKLTGIWNYVRTGQLTRAGGKKQRNGERARDYMYALGPNAG